MKLVEALGILNGDVPEQATELNVFLASGFTPLHLKTFLAAHLRLLFPDRRIAVDEGRFGDLAGNLQRLRDARPDAGIIAIEWSDLDPRLGCRQLGGWAPAGLPGIVDEAAARLDALAASIEAMDQGTPLTIALPGLPLPPLSYSATWDAAGFELELRDWSCRFAVRMSRLPLVTVINPQRLDQDSPPGTRYQIASDITTGFPYTLPHASALANLLALAVRKPVPRKGLITDLDDTLWSGILGEVGIDGVSWDLDHHTHIHGLYQQFLDSLAQAGILVAVASKNDPALVERALERNDLLLKKDRIFPVEAHWEPKSKSIHAILRAWNIAADAVVFIDDSPMELAEVAAAHPGIECLLFPKTAPAEIYAMLFRLRDWFGKSRLGEEDALRLETLRRGSAFREQLGESPTAQTDFLRHAEAVLSFSFDKQRPDPRALELVNKTNQFNLNGVRFTEASWRQFLEREGAFLMVVSYRDRYGPLGKISVIAGRIEEAETIVECWVLSCRAFTRRIEHRCLDELFRRFSAAQIRFSFQPTEKNSPLQEFFSGLLGDAPPGSLVLTREAFLRNCPELFQNIEEPATPLP